MDWLKMIAPTLATAIAGPFGAMAYGIAAKALDISPEDAQKTIEAGKLTADQIAAVQLAETEIKARAQELGLDFAKLANNDRASARGMQVSNKSLIPAILSVITVLGFFGLLGGAALGLLTLTGSDVLMLLLGVLSRETTSVYAFWLGSSNSSQNKDDLLHKSTPTP